MVDGPRGAGWGGTMAKIMTLYGLICINSKWLNRVEGRSSVGWGVGGNHGQDNDVPCGCKGFLHSFK